MPVFIAATVERGSEKKAVSDPEKNAERKSRITTVRKSGMC